MEIGNLFNRVFELRSKGDYADFAELNENEIIHLLYQSKQFLDTLHRLTMDQLKNQE